MVKSVLGVNHQGLRDWFFQRISAVVMALYSIGLIVFFFMNYPVSYISWHALFVHPCMKIATLLVVLSLLFHAWVGMWTVFTDYIKYFPLRMILYVVVLLGLVAMFFQALFILWGL